jgi:hypothetical protein
MLPLDGTFQRAAVSAQGRLKILFILLLAVPSKCGRIEYVRRSGALIFDNLQRGKMERRGETPLPLRQRIQNNTRAARVAGCPAAGPLLADNGRIEST